MNFKLISVFAALAVMTFVTGCQTNSRQQILSMDTSQVALRSTQSRVFDTVDQTLGLVSATKAGNYLLKLTVTMRPRGESQTMVRASAQHNLKAVSDAVPYQQFFDSLSQALFLEAHEVI